jgi:hypothetical protein
MAAREDGPAPGRSIEAVPPPAAEDPTWERLEDQLSWYDRKSRDNQRRYKWLKLLELAIAAALPVVAAMGSPVGDWRPRRSHRPAGKAPNTSTNSRSIGSPTGPPPRR